MTLQKLQSVHAYNPGDIKLEEAKVFLKNFWLQCEDVMRKLDKPKRF